MSHSAIAAALALDDVTLGERLAAFALASFANSEQRAWPGTRVAAVRAGLSRSHYLAARQRLAERGLIVVEEHGRGRGSSSLISLTFASTGPWFEGEVNPPLLEAVLTYSRTRGSSRLLLAALAALADHDRTVTGVTTEALCGAAGIANSTYRRAQAALLATGELWAKVPGGGRARTNQWVLRDPRAGDPRAAQTPPGRVAPPPCARPLGAAVDQPAVDASDTDDPPGAASERAESPGSTRGFTPKPRSIPDGFGRKPRSIPDGFGTNPARNLARNPATQRARGKGTQEPKNQPPPNPPQGGSPDGWLTVVESFVNERGRKRQRTRTVNLAEQRTRLRQPTAVDATAWQQMRSLFEDAVGQTTFEIWLAPLDLIAVEPAGVLVVSAQPRPVPGSGSATAASSRPPPGGSAVRSGWPRRSSSTPWACTQRSPRPTATQPRCSPGCDLTSDDREAS